MWENLEHPPTVEALMFYLNNNIIIIHQQSDILKG